MTRKRSVVSEVASSQAIDDLKVIRGIGPLTEKHLQDGGIRTLTQLARQSPEDIAARIPNISANQVRKQGWILQARMLAGKKTRSKQHQEEKAPPTSRQHYENFTLEFLLDEKYKIRRLRIMHVQSGDVDTWANWRTEEISQFLARHTGARLFCIHSTPRTNSQALQPNEKPVPGTTIIDTLPTFPIEPVHQTFPETIPNIPLVKPAPQNGSNLIYLLDWTTSLPNSQQSVQSVPHDKNFNVKLTIDINKASLPNIALLDVSGMLFAKKLGCGPRQVIGEAQCVIPYAPVIDLSIDNTTLEQGLYRLEALIKLKPAGSKTSLPEVVDVSFQGGLLQVY